MWLHWSMTVTWLPVNRPQRQTPIHTDKASPILRRQGHACPECGADLRIRCHRNPWNNLQKPKKAVKGVSDNRERYCKLRREKNINFHQSSAVPKSWKVLRGADCMCFSSQDLEMHAPHALFLKAFYAAFLWTPWHPSVVCMLRLRWRFRVAKVC